jgi:cytochrome b561
MGAMLGGALEYNSMRLGFSSLYLIALALYGLAWLTMQPGALSWRQFEANLPEPDLQDEVGASASVSHPRNRI